MLAYVSPTSVDDLCAALGMYDFPIYVMGKQLDVVGPHLLALSLLLELMHDIIVNNAI